MLASNTSSEYVQLGDGGVLYKSGRQAMPDYLADNSHQQPWAQPTAYHLTTT